MKVMSLSNAYYYSTTECPNDHRMLFSSRIFLQEQKDANTNTANEGKKKEAIVLVTN